MKRARQLSQARGACVEEQMYFPRVVDRVVTGLGWIGSRLPHA